MKVYYKTDLNKSYIILEGEGKEEDYQSRVLRENDISGLLPTEIRRVDDKQIFYYDISGKISMQQMYERKNLTYTELKRLIETLLNSIRTLKKYMLSSDCLLLDPKYIFCKKDKFYFCYCPLEENSPAKQFHILTEYFVKEVDYEDEKGVHLAYVMHKATMEENYSLEQIMKEFLQETQRKELPEEEVKYQTCVSQTVQEAIMVAEKKDMWEPVKRLIEKTKMRL